MSDPPRQNLGTEPGVLKCTGGRGGEWKGFGRTARSHRQDQGHNRGRRQRTGRSMSEAHLLLHAIHSTPHSSPPSPSHPLPFSFHIHTLYSCWSSGVSNCRRLAPMWRVAGPGSPRAQSKSSEANTITPRGSQTHNKLSRSETRASTTLVYMLVEWPRACLFGCM